MAHVNVHLTPEEEARTTLCAAAVKHVLEQHGCTITSFPYIAPDGRIEAEAHILPKRTE